jgi:hypothetical protein
MSTLENFEDWLEQEGIKTAEDMLSVYRPVKDNETGWQYTLEPAKGSSEKVILTGGYHDLELTPESREAFVEYMDSLFENGVEVEAAFEHAMAKDD